MAPATRYTTSGDVSIAYQVVGDAPVDLIVVPQWMSQIEHMWDQPAVARWLERLASFSRLILYDRRGSGLSDRVAGTVTLEDQMDDIGAVLDAAGSERAALLAQTEGGPVALLFAATYPERTSALVLYSSFARVTRAPDYPYGDPPEARAKRVAAMLARWGEGARLEDFAPSAAHDTGLRQWLGRLERLAFSPAEARRHFEASGQWDVRDVLGTIRVPTLVLNRAGDTAFDPGHARYLAEHIPGARHVVLPGDDHLVIMGDAQGVLDEIEEFVTGARRRRAPDRALATVLFTDICGSTGRATELGDARWRDLLAQHDALVRRRLGRHGGREVKSVGDGFLATFDGPARAIRCATEIVEDAAELGLDVRAGLHTGECEIIGDDVGGVAVHIGARVCALAGAREVLVSSTVKDLVFGSEIPFADRGTHTLKGVPGGWRLWEVERPAAVAGPRAGVRVSP